MPIRVNSHCRTTQLHQHITTVCSLIVYPGSLAIAEENMAPNSEIHPTDQTPPSFIVQAEDDPVHVENATIYFLALKNAKVPAELHIYSQGGHGYGLRRTALPVTTWPQ